MSHGGCIMAGMQTLKLKVENRALQEPRISHLATVRASTSKPQELDLRYRESLHSGSYLSWKEAYQVVECLLLGPMKLKPSVDRQRDAAAVDWVTQREVERAPNVPYSASPVFQSWHAVSKVKVSHNSRRSVTRRALELYGVQK